MYPIINWPSFLSLLAHACSVIPILVIDAPLVAMHATFSIYSK
jgi:hypothetical protein